MDSCSRAPSPLTPAEHLGLADFLPFDRDTRMDDTAEFLECCSLDYVQPNKITVVSGQRIGVSECSEQCELDGSYTEYVETQWTKASGSEGDLESFCKHDSVDDAIHDIGSDTESVFVNAPLHGPTTVKCVCVCKKRGCKFVNKPFDVHSVRESPSSKMSLRYRMVTWMTALRPQRGAHSPTVDQVDVGAKVHPERKSKIVQMFRSRKFRSKTDTGDAEVPASVETIRKHFPDLCGMKKPPLPGEMRRLKRCTHVSVPRSLVVLFGFTLILLGVTYDHGVKHGVDNLLQSCWSWLRTSYMNFGDEFVSYNSLFFRISNNERLYGEPYPKFGPNSTKKANATRFKDAISNVDPKFLFVLEGLKLSVQMHFFSIDETSDMSTPQVIVHDRGPLFFRISFRRAAGLHVDYIPERSNMSLSTSFQIYDLMKMILLSNDFPYFGMHMHDYLQTTPSALFNMIIDNLKKFNVDTTFLSSIQAQIQKGRIKRQTEEQEKHGDQKPVKPTIETTKATFEPVTPSTFVPVVVNSERKVTESLSERSLNVSSKEPVNTAFERIRRSTEEPARRRSTWRSLAEISGKIFLPLPLDTKKTVLLPVPFIEKNLTLRYRHAVNVLGLPGYQFVLGNDISKGSAWEHPHPDLYPSLSYSRIKDGDLPDDSNNQHQRHKFNEKKKHHRHSKHQNSLESDSYRKSFNDVLGVVDLEPLLLETVGSVVLMGRQLEHYPFWISPPHFLSLTDSIDNVNKSRFIQESLNSSGSRLSLFPSNPTNKNILVGVEGVSANESLHGSFIYYHPILGVPINASLAVQVGVRPPEGMLHAHKLVPIMWTRVQVEEIPLTLWYMLWMACHLREAIMGALIGTGILVVTCGLACSRKKRRLAEGPSSA
ncbi:uncharacterized protein [Cherax quadricarinatus]|uniref:uncharacterized protein n=1 Tax=Cherax quadricarinatus TaxID=27406 RepID=UPI00387E741E